jgi:sugar phosphate permease
MILLVVLIFINAIFLQMYFGPLFSVPVEILGVRKAGISTGFSNFFANIGGLSATYLLGALKDTTGAFKPGFLAICGACFLGLALTFMLARMRRKAIVPITFTPTLTLRSCEKIQLQWGLGLLNFIFWTNG